MLANRLQFRRPLEIVIRIRSEHGLEKAKMSRDLVGNGFVRSCGENNPATFGFLFAQVIKEILAIGQMIRRDAGMRGYEVLETSLPPQQRQWQPDNLHRGMLEQLDQRLEERIGRRECTVQVDDQRHR